ALLVPANRFEVVECLAALQAVRARDLDGEPRGPGPLDVLCQHILNTAAAGPFDADVLFDECRLAGPYAELSRADFDACLDFAATGGYALKAYDRWQRIVKKGDLWSLRDPRGAGQIRLNLGTIEDRGLLKVRFSGRYGGAALGEVEEFFASTLTKGDTFLIGGQIVRFESLSEMQVEVTRDPGRKPKVAVFQGTKFATSTQLSARILAYLKAGDFKDLPPHTADWLALQQEVSRLPSAEQMLVESFPYDGLQHTTFWGFAGRNAMQTLGLLLTRRMEVLGLHPLGFVSTDYAVMIWGLKAVTDPADLLDPVSLRDGFETWLGGNALMKRSFRSVASISGLIDRNISGQRRKLRQATMSSNLLYDTLRKHDPNHIVMRITRDEALRGLVDFGRIEKILEQFQGRIEHVTLDRISPMSAPLVLEIGKVPVEGSGRSRLVEDEARELMRNIGVE
ncbi:MAG: DNA ligase-associated DEXH box helicase, partial [Deltaproteobacteria bacterium]